MIAVHRSFITKEQAQIQDLAESIKHWPNLTRHKASKLLQLVGLGLSISFEGLVYPRTFQGDLNSHAKEMMRTGQKSSGNSSYVSDSEVWEVYSKIRTFIGSATAPHDPLIWNMGEAQKL